MAGASGKKLDETYKLAWLRGLKTTYYLRTLGATHAEKSTVKAGALNAVPADGGVLGRARARSRSRKCALSWTRNARRASKQDGFPPTIPIKGTPAVDRRPPITSIKEIRHVAIRRKRGLTAAVLPRPRCSRWQVARRGLKCCRGRRLRDCHGRAGAASPRQRCRQAHHQRPDRCQSTGAVQIQMGLGEVPVRVRQSLDAAGNPDEPRHCAVEGPQWADRDERRLVKRNLGFFVTPTRSRPTTSCSAPTATSRRRVPPVSAAPGVRRGDPHARLPVHSSRAWASTKARCSTPTTRLRASATRTSS